MSCRGTSSRLAASTTSASIACGLQRGAQGADASAASSRSAVLASQEAPWARSSLTSCLACDFQFDQTSDAKEPKLLDVIDEFIREALAT